MPASTWTPTALQSELRPWQGLGWRAVEALHKNATMALAHGRIDDQALLETILEEVKPRLPKATEKLHWLLSTPFRYAPRQGGSRFRRPQDPGVFYGAETVKTACAEAGYWRLRFWLDSKGLSRQAKTLQLTLFNFQAKTAREIDLTFPPLSDNRAQWLSPSDYRHTQQLAACAREAGVEMIRYESVRDRAGTCLAILSPAVFNDKSLEPNHQQTWNLHIEPPNKITWQRELSGDGFSFEFSD